MILSFVFKSIAFLFLRIFGQIRLLYQFLGKWYTFPCPLAGKGLRPDHEKPHDINEEYGDDPKECAQTSRNDIAGSSFVQCERQQQIERPVGVICEVVFTPV